MIDTPVLVVGYNRPHYLARLINRLRYVQPTTLFVAIDGPKRNHRHDVVNVNECWAIIKNIDWTSQVNCLFREENLGCGESVSDAISWFFTNVSEGIILEDDIIPDPSFFPFCRELLARYRHDHRVFAISGSNVVDTAALANPRHPYRFSHVPHIWGWATWRRTWLNHRLKIADWRATLPASAIWKATGGSLSGTLFWGGMFHMVSRGLIDTWDIQLVHAAMRLNALSVTSNCNLTEHIGAGDGASHMHDPNFQNLPIGKAANPPPHVPLFWDSRADAWARAHHFQAHLKAKQAWGIRHPNFREFVAEVRELAASPLSRPSRARGDYLA